MRRCTSAVSVERVHKSFKNTPNQVVSDPSVFLYWLLATTMRDLTSTRSIHLAPIMSGRPPLLVSRPRMQRPFWRSVTTKTWKSKMQSILPCWLWRRDLKVPKIYWSKGQMTSTNIEVGVIRSDRKFERLSAAAIKDYLDELEWQII